MRRIWMMVLAIVMLVGTLAVPAEASRRYGRYRRDSNGSFWTGLIVGGVGGYLAGRSSSRSRDYYGDRYYDRDYYYPRRSRYYDDYGYRRTRRVYYRSERYYERDYYPRRVRYYDYCD